MKIRVLAIFAFMSFVSGAVAGILPAEPFRSGDAAGGTGNGFPALLAQAAQPSPAPVTLPAAEGAKPSTAAETAPAQEEPPDMAPGGKDADAIKEEEIPGVEAVQPPVRRRPIPSPRIRPYRPGRIHSPPGRQAPSVPAAGEAPSPQVQTRRAGGGFLVKFNNADVYEVIHTLGRMAGINYLIDPRVRGVVNVHTQGTVNKEGALDLLYSILKINGATAVREGEIYHIVPLVEAKTEPLLPEEWKGKEGDPPSNQPMMRAFPLQYIAAAEMAKVIKPFVSAGGDVTEVPRANMVLVMDTAGNMEKHARLVELFDADAFRAAGVKLFPLKFLSPEEMAENLDSIFGALDFGAAGRKASGINFVPLPRMNALLAVTASPKTMENIERWIGELDKEPSGTARMVYLYRVKHGKVKDMMAVLEKLFPGKTVAGAGKPTEFKPKVAEPAARTAAAAGQGTRPAPRQEGGAKEGTGTFDIIPDEPTNSIIIRGSASEYAALLNVLRTIDIYPLQVLLEVLIAEVQLDDELRLGIDWRYMSQSGDETHDLSLITSASGINTGLLYAFEKTNRLMASVRALADDGKVSILSSPSVISTNGKESKIEVAQQIPVNHGDGGVPGRGDHSRLHAVHKRRGADHAGNQSGTERSRQRHRGCSEQPDIPEAKYPDHPACHPGPKPRPRGAGPGEAGTFPGRDPVFVQDPVHRVDLRRPERVRVEDGASDLHHPAGDRERGRGDAAQPRV
jgi:general secretion pathway protein D